MFEYTYIHFILIKGLYNSRKSKHIQDIQIFTPT